MLPEDRMKKIARLPGNCVCPNCATEKRFGFGNVCMLSLAFVCNSCKSSHQAYSHRCKSLTMSTWTDAEVLQLSKAGNDVCRRSWLAKAPPVGQGGRPQPGSDISIYKRFVEAAYVQKLYHSGDEGSEDCTGPTVSPPLPSAAADAAFPEPEFAVTDLLGFDTFESPVTSPPTSFHSAPATDNNFVGIESARASVPMASASVTLASSSQSVPSQPSVKMEFDPFGFSSLAVADNRDSLKSCESYVKTDLGNDSSSLFGSHVNAGPFPTTAIVKPDRKPVMETRNGTASAISAMGCQNMGRMMIPPIHRLDAPLNTMMPQQLPVLMTPTNVIGMIPLSQQSTATGSWSEQQQQQEQQMNRMMSSRVHRQEGQRQTVHGFGSNAMPMFSGMNGGTWPQSNQSYIQPAKQDRQQQPQSNSRPDPFANLF